MTEARRARGGRKLLTDVVRDELRRDLAGGVYGPGDRLPAEPELAAALGVSRITLREAVRGLVEEGYLSRQQGTGTYVTKKPKLRNNLDVNFGVTELIRRMGLRPGNRDVRVTEEPAPETVAAALSAKPGRPVARLERVRTADDDPVVFSVEFVPLDLLDGDAARLRNLPGSLYELLADLGHQVDHGVARLKAVVADETLARKLRTEPGAPLLHLEQVDYAPDDRPVLYSLEWYPGQELDVTVYRKGAALPDA